MRPGEALTLVIGRQTVAGVPVTGKLVSDFAIGWKKDGVTTAITTSCTEVDTVGTWREYRIGITLPTGGPYVLHGRIDSISGTDVVDGGVFDAEIESHDYDSLASLIPVIPVAQLSATTRTADPQTLKLIANRYTPVSFAVKDANGAVVPLNTYTNWRFGVWDKMHTGSIYSLTTGITGDALGIAAWSVPETATFFSAMAAAITAGQDQIELYWDLTADLAGVAAQSQTVLYGKLIMYRNESTS